MPEETLPEATGVAEAPKGGTLGLVIAILAFVAAVVAIVMNVVMKPDLNPLETRIQAVEMSVQANTSDVAALKEENGNMDETIGAMIDEKLAEQAAAEETEEITEDGAAAEEVEE